MSTYRAMSSFSAVEQLSQFGWSLSVRAYRILITGAGAVAVLAAFSGGLLLFRWLLHAVPALLAGTGPSPEVISASAALGCWVIAAYLGAAALIREALTRRRLVVRYNPNGALLRALDIPLSEVFVVKCLPRALFSGCLTLAISASFVIVWHPYLALLPELLAGILLLPLCSTAAVIWAGSRFACTEMKSFRGQWAAFAAATAAALAASWLLGRWSRVLLGGAVPDVDVLLLGSLVGWATVAMLLPLAVLLLVLTARNVRLMRQDAARPVPIADAPRRGRFHARVLHAGPAWWLLSAMFRGLTGHNAAALAARITGISAIIAALGIGFTAGGPGLGFFHDIFAVTRLAALAVFLLSLTVYEVIDRVIGPSGWMRQFRLCLEAGVAPVALAAVAFIATAAVTAAAAAPLSLAGVALTGGGTGLLLIPLATAAAGAIGASLTSSPRTQADGTVESSLVTAIVSVLLSLPVLALLVLPGSTTSLSAVAYTILLIGAGILCLSRRVKHLPSSSWT